MSQQQATERISLTLEDSQKNEIELPFRMLVISDLTCDERSSELTDDPLWSASEGIDAMLSKYRVSTNIRVQDHLTARDDSEFVFQFEPRSMEDFHPDFLLQDVPQLQDVFELYRQLSDSRIKSNRLIEALGELGIHYDAD